MTSDFDPGFEVNDPEVWKGYFGTILPPLIESSGNLREMAGVILRATGDGKELGSASIGIRKLLLGGLNGRKFDNNALSTFISDFVHLKVDETEVTRNLSAADVAPERALAKVTTRIDRSEQPTLKATELIYQEAKAVLNGLPELVRPSFKPSPPPTPNEMMKRLEENPQLIVETLTNFLNAFLAISPSRNIQSMFVRTLSHVPRRYLTLLYPGLYSSEDLLTNTLPYRLFGLSPLFEATAFGLPPTSGKIDGLVERGLGRSLNKIYSAGLNMLQLDPAIRKWYGDSLAQETLEFGRRCMDAVDWDPNQRAVLATMKNSSRGYGILSPSEVTRLCDEAGGAASVFSVISPLCFLYLLSWDGNTFRAHPAVFA